MRLYHIRITYLAYDIENDVEEYYVAAPDQLKALSCAVSAFNKPFKSIDISVETANFLIVATSA